MDAERSIKEFRPPGEQREVQRMTKSVHDVMGGAMVGVLRQIVSDPGSERAQVFIDRDGGGNPVVIEAHWENDRLNQGRQEMATRLLPQFEAAWNNNWQFFLTQNEKSRLQVDKSNQGVVASLKGNGLVRARKAVEDTARLMGEIDLRSRLPSLEVPRAPSQGFDTPPLDNRNEVPLSLALGAGLLTASGAKRELKGFRGILAVVTVAAALAGCRPTPTPRPEPEPTSEIRPVVFEPPATREVQLERVILQNQSTVTIINADIIEGLSIGGEKLPTLTPEGGGEGAILPRPLEELVRLNWGEDFIGKGETLTLVQALEAYVSAVGSAGVEKAGEATTIDLARSYPGLKGPEGDRHLRFFRGQIEKDRGWEEVLTEVVPWQATLKNGVGVVVTGRYHQGLREGEIIIGFNDWVYVGTDGQLVSREVPRVSFAVIKEKDLPGLLQMINPAITYQDGMIAFPGTTEDGRKVIFEWFINTYSQEAYLEVVKKAGLEYISTAEVPVVPHPPEELRKLLPEGSQYSHTNGIRGYFVPGPDGVLSEKAFLLVKYNEETKNWEWSRAPEPESKERVTYGEVKLYHNPGEAFFSVLIPGRVFILSGREQDNFVEISVTENNGATWTAWIQKTSPYAKIGEVPTAEAPQGRFAKEIVLGEGRVVFRNLGTKGGYLMTPYARRPDGTVAKGEEAIEINKAYINEMIARYGNEPGRGNGKNLEVVFDDSPSPYDTGDFFYRYCEVIGDKYIVHIGTTSKFDPSQPHQMDQMTFQASLALEYFLSGAHDALVSGSPGPISPKDLQGLTFPAKITFSQ